MKSTFQRWRYSEKFVVYEFTRRRADRRRSRDDMSASASAFASSPFGARATSRRRSRSAKPGEVPTTKAVSTGLNATESLPLIHGRCVWRGPELLVNPSAWTTVLTKSDIAELESALRDAKRANLDIAELTQTNFKLPTLGPKLVAMTSTNLLNGEGLHLMKGLPVERWDMWSICAAFFGMGAYIGWHCPQNAKGHVLGHVKDLGNDPHDPATRTYTTSAAQPFHTDSADIVGLLCLKNSTQGGESQVVSTAAVYNELVTKNREAALALTKPFPVDRKGEIPRGKSPTYDMPVFHVYHTRASGNTESGTSASGTSEGGTASSTSESSTESRTAESSTASSTAGNTESRTAGTDERSTAGITESSSKKSTSQKSTTLLSGIYDRNFINAAQTRWARGASATQNGDSSEPTRDESESEPTHSVPRLTPQQTAALDALDELCDSKEFRVDMRLEPGDIQWLHNHTTLHARSAYSCVGKEMSERHLLRLWLTPFSNARELPPVFAERFGDLTPGPTRGGIRVDGQKPYCALEPGA